MLSNNEYLIIKSVKFKDNGLIVRALKDNITTFFLSSYLRKGKNIYPFLFYPLSIVEINIKDNTYGTLPQINSAELSYIPSSITYDIIKQTILVFMNDLLYHNLKNDNDSYKEICDYTVETIKFLDKTEQTPLMLPIRFGFDIAEIMGYGLRNDAENRTLINHFEFNDLNTEAISILSQIINTNIVDLHQIKCRKEIGNQLLQSMIVFFQNKIPESGKLKSPKVLSSIF